MTVDAQWPGLTRPLLFCGVTASQRVVRVADRQRDVALTREGETIRHDLAVQYFLIDHDTLRCFGTESISVLFASVFSNLAVICRIPPQLNFGFEVGRPKFRIGGSLDSIPIMERAAKNRGDGARPLAIRHSCQPIASRERAA